LSIAGEFDDISSVGQTKAAPGLAADIARCDMRASAGGGTRRPPSTYCLVRAAVSAGPSSGTGR
jgi:hypothetical protein